MYSSRTLIISVIVVALLAVGITYLATRSDSTSDSTTPTPTPTPIGYYPTPTPTPQRYIVHLTASGVTPATITIRVGDAITFRNDTDIAFWPMTVSGTGGCPGLDATRSLYRGETYSLAFNDSQTCHYLNHADESNASQTGTIIVQ
ncbi:MAG TPA: hypothetical protein VMU12_00540 [Candidatus Paceibacterota bacterium]|nr:hypothetical protein [Candidatus Paceibacterota bacterium]